MPITVKRSIELMGLFILGVIIIYGNQIIMPFNYGFFYQHCVAAGLQVFAKKKVSRIFIYHFISFNINCNNCINY
ncbi:MAG: hypothetical protein ACR2FN_01705 [Chitinophagaceae bacterium]